MEFYYVNSRNEKISFSDFPYLFQDGTLLDNSWSYDTDNDRIKNIRKIQRERTFKLALIPDFMLSLQERKKALTEAATRISEIFDYDVCNGQYGKIYSDSGYYLSCQILNSVPTEWQNGIPYMYQEFTCITETDFWVNETSFKFYPMDNETTGGFEYPFEFSFDFKPSFMSEKYFVNNSFLSADFKITIYGECDNPNINIADHSYSFNCNLQVHERLEIVSLGDKKTITYYAADGKPQNYFNCRNKSESVFDKIPVGTNKISWSGEFAFTLTVFDKRSQPKWSSPEETVVMNNSTIDNTRYYLLDSDEKHIYDASGESILTQTED